MIYRTDLLNQKDLDEQDKILKYFFLIDSEPIVQSLSELVHTTSIDNKNVDKLFHTAFEQIYKASSLYNQFTSPDTFISSGFFGEPGCTSKSETKYYEQFENLRSQSIFLKLALRNYCITEGFFSILTKKTDNNAASFVRLSAPYEGFLNTGYCANPIYDKHQYETVDSDSKSYQFYNSKWHSLQKLGTESLLWYILSDCSKDNDNDKVLDREPKKNEGNKKPTQKPPFDFKVRTCYKYPIYTCFTENKIYQLSKKLPSRSQNILKLYADIMNILSDKENELDLDIDKFIFRTFTEHYFGFSCISYTSSLLTNVYGKQTEEQNHLVKYRGHILENIMKNLSLCPLTYSRQLFLSYALEALHYNQDVSCKYLKNPPSTIGSRSPMETILTDNELTARGLILITKYFNTLNNITLPVLSSLWQVVFHKIFKEKDLSDNILLDYYRTYIDNYHSLLTADFTLLPLSKIRDCCSSKNFIILEDDIDSSFSLDALMKELDSHQRLYPSKINIASETLNNILHDFLLLPKEHPHVLSNTVDLFSKAPPGEKYELQRNTFRYNRANNIFDLFS